MPREWLIQHRAGTLAEWAAAEASGPVLLAGERAYITDLKLDVVGDGVTKVAGLGAVGSGTYVRRVSERLRAAARDAAGNNALERPPLAPTPVITTSTSDPDASVSVTYYFTVSAAQAACFKYRGGVPTIHASIYYRFPVVTLPTGVGGNSDAAHNANGWAVEFMTDAPRVKAFMLNSVSPNGVAFEVDGRVVSATPTAFPASSGGGYFLLDFTLGSVAFTDAGDVVTVTLPSGVVSHDLQVGDRVMFGTITSTTGITANTTYYVKTVPSATTLTLSATPGGTTLALTTNGTSTSISKAATRRFRIEGDQATGMRGVHIPPSYTVWAPQDQNAITACVVGDSNVAQTGATCPNGGYAISMGKMLGWSDVREIAFGGTGWVNQGSVSSTFGDATRVADVVAAAPDILVLGASTNDNASSAATITAAALAGFQAYRTALPNVPIIVMGVQPGSGGPAAATLTNEAAVKAAFVAWGDANAWFIDVSNDPQGSWIAGTGRVGATSGTGNSNIYINNADTIHMTQAGNDYFAARGAAAIRTSVLPNIRA